MAVMTARIPGTQHHRCSRIVRSVQDTREDLTVRTSSTVFTEPSMFCSLLLTVANTAVLHSCVLSPCENSQKWRRYHGNIDLEKWNLKVARGCSPFTSLPSMISPVPENSRVFTADLPPCSPENFPRRSLFVQYHHTSPHHERAFRSATSALSQRTPTKNSGQSSTLGILSRRLLEHSPRGSVDPQWTVTAAEGSNAQTSNFTSGNTLHGYNPYIVNSTTNNFIGGNMYVDYNNPGPQASAANRFPSNQPGAGQPNNSQAGYQSGQGQHQYTEAWPINQKEIDFSQFSAAQHPSNNHEHFAFAAVIAPAPAHQRQDIIGSLDDNTRNDTSYDQALQGLRSGGPQLRSIFQGPDAVSTPGFLIHSAAPPAAVHYGSMSPAVLPAVQQPHGPTPHVDNAALAIPAHQAPSLHVPNPNFLNSPGLHVDDAAHPVPVNQGHPTVGPAPAVQQSHVQPPNAPGTAAGAASGTPNPQPERAMCQGTTRKKVYYPCPHNKPVWKYTGKGKCRTCFDCLANPMSPALSFFFSSTSPPHSIRPSRADSTKDGGLCEGCYVKKSNNSALRKKGEGKGRKRKLEDSADDAPQPGPGGPPPKKDDGGDGGLGPAAPGAVGTVFSGINMNPGVAF
ncbi:hypothetical protein B0T20DRAFT_392409 [Sordaria brevicollis]|uniref:Uncharacterized protein n=1 Tax=Sordaria brevicollis TaxID=83679 RepID=A0AAE0UCT9_SORBR|nr:hypothetical protein B0T20DRAFT_392409 [Sordaria brevicollis]